MCRRLLMCVVLLAGLLTSGCAQLGGSVRRFGISFAEEDVKNSAAIREMAALFKEAWPESSGFWRAIFKDDIKLEAVAVMDRLDELAAKPELTGNEPGEFVGLRALFCKYLTEFLIGEVGPYVGFLI